MTKPFNFMQTYRQYAGQNESDKRYHIFSALTIIGARIGRNLEFKFGHDSIYPNMYVLLVGVPASRKSTAMNIAKRLLKSSGYNKLGFDKSSREKFLMDLEVGFDFLVALDMQKSEDLQTVLTADIRPVDLEELLAQPMLERNKVQDVFLGLAEFCDFIGQNNVNFVTTLTNLYDNPPNYPERLKNSKSVNILNPTITILGCLTPSHFSSHLPPELIGQGFMSRLILVYGEKSEQRITIPPQPDKELESQLIAHLKKIGKLRGKVTITKGALDAVDKIYKNFTEIEDIRFQYYCSRRLTHLLKLSIICAAMHLSKEIKLEHVIEANTYLVGVETYMPNALGEYGESKLSGAAQKVLDALRQKNGAMTGDELLSAVRQDITGQRDMVQILEILKTAGKIKINSKNHSVLLCTETKSHNNQYTDFAKYFPEILKLTGEQL